MALFTVGCGTTQTAGSIDISPIGVQGAIWYKTETQGQRNILEAKANGCFRQCAETAFKAAVGIDGIFEFTFRQSRHKPQLSRATPFLQQAQPGWVGMDRLQGLAWRSHLSTTQSH